MIKLPLSKTTFKRSFLNGKGEVQISSDQDSWTALVKNNEPFNRDVDDIARLGISVGTGQKNLQVGSKQGLAVTVSATGAVDGSVRLIWPQQQDELLDTYGVAPCLTDGKVYAALTFNGTSDATGDASFPSGPLSATFNLGAGGHVAYTRLMLFDQSKPARDLLRDLASAPILPQNIDLVTEIPAECEVRSLRYGGYLKVAGGLNWGYSFAGVEQGSLGELDLALSYTARAAASMSLGYRLAGEFDVEAQRGSKDGWVRFVVRKSRASNFDFGADFGLDAGFELSGLPQSSEDFLAALLGTDTRAMLGYLDQATRLTNLDNLKQELDGLAVGFFQNLTEKWLGKALDNDTVEEFLGIARKVVETYNNIDQRIIEIYESYLGKVPELTAILAKLDQVTSLEGFENLSDSKAWELLERLFGDRLRDLLLDNDGFQEIRDLVTAAKDFLESGAKEKIRQFVAEVKEKLGLDSLIGALSTVSDEAQLKALVDQKIQGLVGRVLGKAFDKIEASKIGEAVEKINRFLVKVQDFDEYYQKFLSKVTAQSISMSLNYKFSRATSRDALFDVELNLTEKTGRDLARAAGGGDFSRVLKTYDPKILRVNQGVMTSKFEKSSHLQINFLGWSKRRAVDVMSNLEHAIQSDPGGLVHVYTLDAQIKQSVTKGRRFKEETQSSFLLQAVGASVQPAGGTVQNEKDEFLIQTLRKLAVQYDLVQKDERTTVAELTEYLRLAAALELIPSREEDVRTGGQVLARHRAVERVVTQLRREFPSDQGGLGKVEANYVVRYDDQAVRSAFTVNPADMEEIARLTTRRLIATQFVAKGPSSALARVGFAYLSTGFARLHEAAELVQKGRTVVLPGWFTASGRRQPVSVANAERYIVNTLFNVEDTFVKRLKAFDKAVDKAVSDKTAVPENELVETARKFVAMAARLDKFTPGEDNSATFFGVFDRLVRQGSAGKGRRESSMILKITPPGGETVTKYFMG